MSTSLKIILPVAVGVAVAIGIYSARLTTTTPPQTANAGIVAGEKVSAEAEIDAIIQAALAEPTGSGEEDKDSAVLTSDTEILNNFNTVYESDI